MTKKEFVNVLECVLRAADSHISMAEFKRGCLDAIEIFYDNDILYSVPVKGMTLLGILNAVTKTCCEIRGLNDLEESLKKIDKSSGVYPETFDEWKESVIGNGEIDKFLYYLYRMTPLEKDYIFGKMSVILLEYREAHNPTLRPE